MKTIHQFYCRCAKVRSFMRMIPKYCSLLFLGVILATRNFFTQRASAQTPSGDMRLIGPDTTPIAGREFNVSVQLIKPHNVDCYQVDLQYPDVVDFVRVNGADGNPTPTVHTELSDHGNKSRYFTQDLSADKFFSDGLLFTATFITEVSGDHKFEIVGGRVMNGHDARFTNVSALAIIVTVESSASGSITFHRSQIALRVNIPSTVQIRLQNRLSVHHYSITIDPSKNLGSIAVIFDSDDVNGTEIRGHTAGAPIMISAQLVDRDSEGLRSDDAPVAALVFTPTAAGTATLEITSAKVYSSRTDTMGTDVVIRSMNPLTFDVTKTSNRITTPNTETGPTPIITLMDVRKLTGFFDVGIAFQSENRIVAEINADARIGLESKDIVIGGTAGAFLAEKFWVGPDDNGFIARITPTRTGTVTIQVPAGVVTEIGTNLPNVASEVFSVNVELDYPPWDVNEDGSVDETDSALVTAALGQTGDGIMDPRTDVNGDGTVDQNDLTLVTSNIGTDGGVPSNVNLFRQLDRTTLESLDRRTLEASLNTLHAESDGSLKYERAIAILKRVLTITRPE